MRAAAKRRADVLGEHANIRALAAAHAQFEIGRLPGNELELADRDLASMTRDLHARARIFVVLAPVALERGVAWRHLRDATKKALQHRFDIAPRGGGLARRN